MNNGWIKLHRQFQKWEWYADSHTVHLFVHLLLSANHEEGRWKGITIKRGQFVTGRKQLHSQTHISEQTLRTCLERLKSTNEITIQVTNRFSVITITNYEKYQQSDFEVTSKSTSQLTNNQPATNQQLTTNKKDKKEKNEKNPLGIDKEILDELSRYETIGNPSAYLSALKKKAKPESIRKAWNEWKRGSGIESPADFYARSVYWSQEL
jgi:hypothetical protein